jgi:hypothetical protein
MYTDIHLGGGNLLEYCHLEDAEDKRVKFYGEYGIHCNDYRNEQAQIFFQCII